MSFEFMDGRHFVGVWFVSDGSKDWMGAAWRDSQFDRWTIEYRFRYYRDRKAHDSADEKNWYGGTCHHSVTPDVVKGKIDLAAAVVAMAMQTKVEFCDMRDATTGEECLRRLAKCKWAHLKSSAKAKA